MSTSEALRAVFFLFLVILACLFRAYVRNRSSSEGGGIAWETKPNFWRATTTEASINGHERDGSADAGQPRRHHHATDHDRDPERSDVERGRGMRRQSSAQRRSRSPSSLQLVDQHLVEKLAASFDESQSRRAGAESAHASDEVWSWDSALEATLEPQARRLGIPDLPALDRLGVDLSESSSPSYLQGQFPAAQLRPY